jgi:hypothetical protein
MNQTIKKINQEKILFFDLEVVRKSKELDINSKEFELFQKKTRNRETDELLPDNQVVEEYAKRAALKMGYMKVVSVGVGFIKDNEVHIKSLSGEEDKILKQFCTIANSFDYVCGVNILAYDLPVVAVNGSKYFDITENLVDRFITSGKKPWNLDRVIDLIDVFKGTHYANTSLDEMCYHFDLPSPKTDLDGSMVSEEYWTNGVEKIDKYVKQDVFASVNLFKKMRFEQPFESFIDKNENTTVEPFVEEVPLLQRIYKAVSIDSATKEKIEQKLNKSKLTKKDKEIVEDILTSLYVNNTMFSSDKPEVKEQKKLEIKQLVNGK